MTASGELPPLVPVRMLSDALAALGVHAEPPPTGRDLARAQEREGRAALTARLANALYGRALAQVMSVEYVAGVAAGCRAAAWQAAGVTEEGTAILLHYTAMRLTAELRLVAERLPVEVRVMGAADGAAQALTLLLEACTVRTMDDPRAPNITTNLARAQDQLATAAERIEGLLQDGRDVATAVTEAARPG